MLVRFGEKTFNEILPRTFTVGLLCFHPVLDNGLSKLLLGKTNTNDQNYLGMSIFV